MSDDTPPVTPPRRRFPFLIAVVVVLLAVAAFLRHPPAFVLAGLMPKLAATLTDAIGVPVRLGAIDDVILGVFQQEVVVSGFAMAESPDRPQAIFIGADQIRLRWRGMSYLFGGKAPVGVVLVHPHVFLRLDKQGKFAFQPKEKPKKPPGPDAHGPDLGVRWENADIHWQDDKAGVTQTVLLPRGEATLGDLRQVTWKTGGTLVGGTLVTQGSVDLKTGDGRTTTTFDRLNVMPFATYIPKLPVRIVEARLDGQAAANWKKWGQADLSVRVNGQTAAVLRSTNWRGPLSAQGRFRLTESQVTLDPLEGRLADQPVTVKGSVRWKPHLFFDLLAKGNDLALTKLAKAIPGLEKQPLSGVATLTARVHGDRFVMTGVLDGRRLGFGPYVTGQTTASFRLTDKDISLDPRLTFGGGTIRTQIAVTFPAPQRMTVDADVQHVRLDALVPGLKGNKGMSDTIDGHLKLAGPPSAPVLTATVHGQYGLPTPLPPLRDIQVSATGTVTDGEARLTGALSSGHLALTAGWAGDRLRGLVALHDVPATLVQPWVPDVEGGLLSFDGRLNASRRAVTDDWRAFMADGTLSVASLALHDSPRLNATHRWDWQAGTWHVAGDWRSQADHLQLAGQGLLPKQPRGIPPMRLTWQGDVRNLAAWLPMTELQHGIAHTEGQMRYAGGWNGDVKVRVGDLTIRQTELGGGHLQAQLANETVTIQDGVWQRGEEQLRLSGTVGLAGGSPRLALQARIEQAAVENLLKQYRAFTRRVTQTAPLPPDLPIADRLPRLDRRPAVLNKPDLRHVLPSQIPVLAVLDYWMPIARMYPPIQDLGQGDSSDGVPVKGKLSAYVRITGTAYQPVVTGSAAVSELRVGDYQVASARVQGQWAGDRWDLADCTVLTGNGGVLHAKGQVNQGKVVLEATGKGVDLGLLKPMMASTGYVLTGAADLLLDVSGSVRHPKALMALTVKHGRLNASPFDVLDIDAGLENDTIDVARLVLRQGKKDAVMTGTIPLSVDRPMDISLRANDESLGLISLVTRQAEWLSGRGLVTLSLTGTPREPKMDGRLVLKDVRIYLPGLGETIDSLQGTVLLTHESVPASRVGEGGGTGRMRIQNAVRIESLTGKYNGGLVSINGSIDLPSRSEPGFWGLRVNGTDLAIHRGGLYDGLASAALTVRGELSEPVISGKVTLAKGISSLSRGAQSEVSAGGSTTRKAAPPVKISNLKVELGNEFWVRTPIFELQPHGTVVLDWRDLAGVPTVRGMLISNKGLLTLTSYQFKVTEAKIEFVDLHLNDRDTNAPPINPKMDMTITGSIPNPHTTDGRAVPVVGHFSAFLENLETQGAFKLTWSNEAGLTDEDITKVVSGRTIADVASGNLTKVAGNISPIVTRALFDPITDRLAQLLTLDEVNIGLGSSLADPAFSVALSKPLIGGLSVGFSRVFSAQPVTTYSLRYRVLNNWSLLYAYEDPKDRTGLGTLSTQFNAKF